MRAVLFIVGDDEGLTNQKTVFSSIDQSEDSIYLEEDNTAIVFDGRHAPQQEQDLH